MLVIGGAGFIGSITSWHLAKEGYNVIILDNFLYTKPRTFEWAEVVIGDYGDSNILDQVFTKYKIDAVMHFGALIQVAESVKHPDKYYKNNVTNTITLLDSMVKNNVNYIIFSSSAAVYGMSKESKVKETCLKNPINPYGKTKLMMEMVLEDYSNAYNIKYCALRYFNAAGAMPELNLGQRPGSHLIASALDALYNKKEFNLFGENYETKDGTCIRDFIHVIDLADAHIKALQYIKKNNISDEFNLGTSNGFSVKEIIAAVEKVTQTKIPVKICDKRAGDPVMLIADNTKAKELLKWEPRHSDLESMISSANSYFKNNL